METFVTERTDIDCDRLLEVYETKHDWFMDAKEALELGVINKII